MTRGRQALLAALGVGALATGFLAAVLMTSPGPAPTGVTAVPSTAGPGASGTAPGATSGSPGLGPTVAQTALPTATPSPTPILVAAPLTGRLVDPAAAAHHPIAVMIDDLWAARPQSGFTDASIVWQAPAEGGIPRYMLIFGENVPESVGPVRSSRYYYIAWAAEWRAVYVHVGGSPQALQTLRAEGQGQLVYDADEFSYGGKTGYLWRVTERYAPHNVYSDGIHLRKLARRVGAADGPITPVWTFAPDAPLAARPQGGGIELAYPANTIRYDYDRRSNTYLRWANGEKQVDAATGKRVRPKNVVVVFMRFGPLNDGHPQKGRLEADVVGEGAALIATNGRTVKGTWRKHSLSEPTLLFDDGGQPIVLTAGQTFVQVLPLGTPVTVRDGSPAPPAPRKGPAAR